MIHIVLYQPEKPMNTGNIMRTCKATGACLHIIGPLTYQIDDKYGYNIIDIINEKYGIVEKNDNNPYFISVNYLVMKNNNQYQLIEK